VFQYADDNITARVGVLTVSRMSKVGPDADWSLCWDVWAGITKKPIEKLKICEITADDFEIPPERKRHIPGERGLHVGFGGVLLGEMVWINKPDEYSHVEIDGEIKWRG
jgi:hypothetical protein